MRQPALAAAAAESFIFLFEHLEVSRKGNDTLLAVRRGITPWYCVIFSVSYPQTELAGEKEKRTWQSTHQALRGLRGEEYITLMDEANGLLFNPHSLPNSIYNLCTLMYHPSKAYGTIAILPLR